MADRNIADYINPTTMLGFEALLGELRKEISPKTLDGLKGLDYGAGQLRATRVLTEAGAIMEATDSDIKAVKDYGNNPLDIRYWPMNFMHLFYSEHRNREMLFDFAISTFVHVHMATLDEMVKANRYVHDLLNDGAPYLILTIDKEALGQTYDGFSSKIPKSKKLRAGDTVKVKIDMNGYEVTRTDYVHPKEDYILSLQQAGFESVSDMTVAADRKPDPFLLLVAKK